MGTTCLQDRGVMRIGGGDAVDFLQNILTCDIPALTDGKAGFGALLSPQGKILFDFIVYRAEDGHFLFDTARERMEAFAKRLGFYRLRAKVTVEDVSATLAVIAGWNDTPPPAEALTAAPDPRLAALGWRAIIRCDDIDCAGDEAAYHAHRIGLAVPEGGRDFAFESVFPHEADMDQLHGVSFSKGCYVGQEIVSRMQHRGTARTRFLSASYDTREAPPVGTDIVAGGKIVGKTGSGTAGRLVAMVRIDKVLDAMAEGIAIEAGDIALSLDKPLWADFDFSPARKG